jgi:hypothetical protein
LPSAVQPRRHLPPWLTTATGEKPCAAAVNKARKQCFPAVPKHLTIDSRYNGVLLRNKRQQQISQGCSVQHLPWCHTLLVCATHGVTDLVSLCLVLLPVCTAACSSARHIAYLTRCQSTYASPLQSH